jgi:hypothetical protein
MRRPHDLPLSRQAMELLQVGSRRLIAEGPALDEFGTKALEFIVGYRARLL